MRELIETVSRELATDSDSAASVIAALLGRKRYEVYMKGEIGDCIRAKVLSQLRQMKKGKPIEYITRTVQFRDHVLRIDPGVFIPRTETEYLIEMIHNRLRNHPKRILEIGTGCGVISIALASVYPNACIIATDVSAQAIANARQNIMDQALERRINLVQCSMYDCIADEFDLIVSNPPYIPRPRLNRLPRSVRKFEPILALDGGVHGVEFTQRLILEGKECLSDDGVMVFEIDDDAVAALTRFLDDHGIDSFFFLKDLFGRSRYLFIGA